MLLLPALAVVAAVVFLFHKFSLRRGKVHPPIVGGYKPFIGESLKFFTDPITAVREAQKQHGPIFTLYLAGKPWTWVLGDETRKLIFRAPDHTLAFEFEDFGINEALHIPKDPEYNQDYQHAIRLMHTKLIVDIDDMISTIVDIGKRHIQKYFSHNIAFELSGTQGSFDIQGSLFATELIGATTATCAFGERIGQNTEFMSMYYNQFREVERATTLTFLLPKTLQQLWLKPLDKYYVITQRVFGEEIALRRQSGTSRNDLLQAMMESPTSRGTPMSDRHIAIRAEGIMFAAIVNTRTALVNTLAFIAAHPEAQSKIREEVVALLKQSDGKIGSAFIRDAKYLDACVKETLRAMEDVQVGQYIIPKGDFVCLSGYFVHYDENIFPEPTKWRPERWLEGKSLPLATFGAGKHMCLGRLLATAEVKVTVALLLQKYELRLPNGLPPLDFSKSSIVPFVGGCVMEYSPL